MKTLRTRVWNFCAAEDGPAAVEYAVVLMAILLAALSGIVMVGEATSQKWTDSSAEIQVYFN
jgi:Flp pilus assembly pilin Flp